MVLIPSQTDDNTPRHQMSQHPIAEWQCSQTSSLPTLSKEQVLEFHKDAYTRIVRSIGGIGDKWRCNAHGGIGFKKGLNGHAWSNQLSEWAVYTFCSSVISMCFSKLFSTCSLRKHFQYVNHLSMSRVSTSCFNASNCDDLQMPMMENINTGVVKAKQQVVTRRKFHTRKQWIMSRRKITARSQRSDDGST